MKKLNIMNLPRSVVIGRQTETGVEQVSIDCSAWLDKWPAMTVSIWPSRPGESAAYLAMSHMEGKCLVWDVNAADTALAGAGTVEIVGIAKDQKKLSEIIQTYVFKTTTVTTSEVPEAAKPWVDTVLDAAERAEEAAKRAEAGGVGPEQIEHAVHDYLEQNPPQGVSDEHIRDVTAAMLDEAKESGAFDGRDGYTPVKGVDYFDGKDGKDGTDGQPGQPGKDGVDGKDGYTPIKGVDYFDGKDGKDGADGKDYILTDADKREIAGMVEVSGGGTATDEHINSLIDAKLGVIENGAY